MFSDDEYIMISSLQHLAFCERQWSLIHIESEWKDNVLTVEGRAMHDHVHEDGISSKPDARLVRGMRLRNEALGLYGVADLVELRKSNGGVRIPHSRGRYLPYPVEYKHGQSRPDDADEVQLAAQAMCLEEMFDISVSTGAVFYGKPKRRYEVQITQILRDRVVSLCSRARELISLSARPLARVGKHCGRCSLADICMPDVISRSDFSTYNDEVIRIASDT